MLEVGGKNRSSYHSNAHSVSLKSRPWKRKVDLEVIKTKILSPRPHRGRGAGGGRG